MSYSKEDAANQPAPFDLVRALYNERMTVREIADKLDKERGHISNMLSGLRELGIVDYTKKGKESVYTFNTDGIPETFLTIWRMETGEILKLSEKRKELIKNFTHAYMRENDKRTTLRLIFYRDFVGGLNKSKKMDEDIQDFYEELAEAKLNVDVKPKSYPAMKDAIREVS